MNKHKNPLLPLKNYLLLSKISEELKEKGEVSEDKLEKLNKLQAENAHRNREKQIPLKLSSMITLTIMKSSHESGCVKKMLHAPTLKLYAVKVSSFLEKATYIICYRKNLLILERLGTILRNGLHPGNRISKTASII